MIRQIAAALVLVAAFTPSAAQAAGDRWDLRWNPSPARDGVNAFEALEDDRRGSHADGMPHVYTDRNAWRFDMHNVDRDGSDRQRNEVRGMRDGRGRALEMRKDETWRISWQMYIPDTLDATSSFSHIWQLKTSDIGTPVAQLSLPIKSGVQKIEARYWTLADNATHGFASYDLEAIQNKWVTTTIEIKSSDKGYMRWVLKDGHRTLVDQRIDDIDFYWTEEQYNRPKWGIYRSIRSTGLQDTHMLVRDLKAWTLGPVNPPVSLPAPDPAAYEAERKGTLFEGAAEPVYCRICSGGLKTILIGGNTYDYTTVKGILSETTATKEMTVHAVVNGAQSFRISVNGADSVEVPMTGTPDKITTTTVQVPLIAGVNNIRFFNLTARTPELDKIVIR
ncbi:hypothetical protein [Nonomuraea endophytica]|uniref:hypothetical protein n=1 Tax=Nonomuraea endophytica TaxID=714136 RepID=UPI0037CC5732